MGSMSETLNRTQIVARTELKETSKRQQVGILGGNFNPVHHAHLIVADQVYHQLGLDKIYLMPTYEPPHIDHKTTISSELRLDMLELALASDDYLEIETLEINRAGKSYTYETMKTLTELNPDVDYYFIIGGDMVEYLPKWYEIEKLMSLVQLVGVRRPNYPITSEYPLIWVDVPLMDISSSLIRAKVAKGDSVNYLLPRDVINYIEMKGLYRDG
ncbi:nicotinate-nucleotide adenylyltransferase [Vagococcus intermedius]|uniref:nicotinate-nucleotide adenylyltransferase n=1 Tax=Vagococcus intermedius TaxID=2991418 RepID=UPI003F5A259F